MTAYTPTGPFTDNTTPPLAAGFFNNMEAWIKLVDNSTPVTINGGTSGTAVCYQPLQGTIKMVVIIETNFRTGGSNQDYTLPVPFTTKGLYICGDTDTFTFMNGGSGQNVDQVTTLGSASNQGSATSHSFGGITHPFDTIRFNASAGSAHNSTIIVIGV